MDKKTPNQVFENVNISNLVEKKEEKEEKANFNADYNKYLR